MPAGVKRSRETDEGQEPPSKRVDTLDGKKNAKLDSPAPKSEKPQSSSAHLPEGQKQSDLNIIFLDSSWMGNDIVNNRSKLII